MFNRIANWFGRLAGRGRIKRSGADEFGAEIVEYALILTLVAVLAIAPVTALGKALGGTRNDALNDLAATAAANDAGAANLPTWLFGSPDTLQFPAAPASQMFSVAATGGATPITYTGDLPHGDNGFAWTAGNGNTDGSISITDPDVSQYGTTFSITGTDSAGSATESVIVWMFVHGPIDSLVAAPPVNDCTVTADTVSCSSYSFVTGATSCVGTTTGPGGGGPCYIDYEGQWTLIDDTNAMTMIDYGLANGWSFAGNPFTIPNSSFPADGDLYS